MKLKGRKEGQTTLEPPNFGLCTVFERDVMFPPGGIVLNPFSSLSLFQLLKVGMHQVVLQEVNLNSTGRYKCQITESRPPFHTEQRERDLTVISEY